VQVTDLENHAFLRAQNAGSVYKLATAYALARAGRLEASAKSPGQLFSCDRFTWYAAASERDGRAPALSPAFSPDGPRSQPCGKHGVMLADPANGFHDAFRQSINLYFGVAPLALVLDPRGLDRSRHHRRLPVRCGV
jgi:hypothetical protein